MRSSLFWNFTQCRLAVHYEAVGPPIGLIFKGHAVQEENTGEYPSALCEIPEKLSSHLHHSGNPK